MSVFLIGAIFALLLTVTYVVYQVKRDVDTDNKRETELLNHGTNDRRDDGA